jgi:putative redox protein
MKIKLNYQGQGAAFNGVTDDGQQVTLDGSSALGGQGLGARPMQLVLFGLAGCAAMDVLHIIRKGRRDLTYAQISVDAERADSIPAVFSSIHLIFDLGGEGLTQSIAERAVKLSIERYCSVAQMLSPHVEITASVNVIASAEE